MQKIRMIIYLENGGEITIDTAPKPLPELKSGRIYQLDADGTKYNVRPYYRRTVDDVTTIFMEEDNTNEKASN